MKRETINKLKEIQITAFTGDKYSLEEIIEAAIENMSECEIENDQLFKDDLLECYGITFWCHSISFWFRVYLRSPALYHNSLKR